MGRRMTMALLAGSMLALTPAIATAQVRFGAHLNWGDDADFGLGGRVSVPLTTKTPLEIQGSFDYFFPSVPAGGDLTYWEINGNLVYLVPIQRSSLSPYVGGGLNIAHASLRVGTISGGDEEVGLNLLGGLAFKLKNSRVRPFVEVRAEVKGGEQVVLSGGVQF